MDKSVNALFDRSLDIFAKIVPGLILLLALLISCGSWDDAGRFISSLPSGAWVAVFAAAWLTGFGVQSLGEVNLKLVVCSVKFMRLDRISFFNRRFFDKWLFKEYLFNPKRYDRQLIRYYPRKIGKIRDWYKKTAFFRQHAKPEQQSVVNRLSLVKEACGNVYVALLLATMLIVNQLDFLFVLFNVIIAFFLWRMHSVHVKRQWEYMEAVLALGVPTKQP